MYIAWRLSISSHFLRFALVELFEADRFQVAALLLKVAVFVEHVGDAAGHAGARSCGPVWPMHDDAAAGHVFAAVIAHAFDDRVARRCCARRSARRPCRGCRLRRWSRRRSATLPTMMFSSGAKVEPAGG